MRTVKLLACMALLTVAVACEGQQGTTTSQQGDVVFSGSQYK